MIAASAQYIWLSMFAGSMAALTVCVLVLSIAYVGTRALNGPNRSLWLKIAWLLILFAAPAAFGLAVSYPLYLKHVCHAASIFSDTPPEMSRYLLAYSGGLGITLALGLWWLNRHARRLQI